MQRPVHRGRGGGKCRRACSRSTRWIDSSLLRARQRLGRAPTSGCTTFMRRFQAEGCRARLSGARLGGLDARRRRRAACCSPSPSPPSTRSTRTGARRPNISVTFLDRYGNVDRQARHPAGRHGPARGAARQSRSRRCSPPRTGASSSISASTSSARSARCRRTRAPAASCRAAPRSPSSSPRTCSCRTSARCSARSRRPFSRSGSRPTSPSARSSSSISTAPIWAAALSASARRPSSISARRCRTSTSPRRRCSPASSRRRPRYAPHINLPAARARANEVLSNMVQAGFVTEGQVIGARRNPAVAGRAVARSPRPTISSTGRSRR